MRRERQCGFSFYLEEVKRKSNAVERCLFFSRLATGVYFEMFVFQTTEAHHDDGQTQNEHHHGNSNGNVDIITVFNVTNISFYTFIVSVEFVLSLHNISFTLRH